jgi:hypothetical protein
MNIFLEALLVGLLTSVVGFIISTLLMFTNTNFNLKNYRFWPSVVLSYFITGFIIHLLCELTKLNKWYCMNGNACKMLK